MRTYNIYLDRIEVLGDNGLVTTSTLRNKLLFLSSDFYNYVRSTRLGKGCTYRRMSFLIDELVNLIDNTSDVNETSVVGVLRYSLSFVRRFEFPHFQINILNHV